MKNLKHHRSARQGLFFAGSKPGNYNPVQTLSLRQLSKTLRSARRVRGVLAPYLAQRCQTRRSIADTSNGASVPKRKQSLGLEHKGGPEKVLAWGAACSSCLLVFSNIDSQNFHIFHKTISNMVFRMSPCAFRSALRKRKKRFTALLLGMVQTIREPLPSVACKDLTRLQHPNSHV